MNKELKEKAERSSWQRLHHHSVNAHWHILIDECPQICTNLLRLLLGYPMRHVGVFLDFKVLCWRVLWKLRQEILVVKRSISHAPNHQYGNAFRYCNILVQL